MYIMIHVVIINGLTEMCCYLFRKYTFYGVITRSYNSSTEIILMKQVRFDGYYSIGMCLYNIFVCNIDAYQLYILIY